MGRSGFVGFMGLTSFPDEEPYHGAWRRGVGATKSL